MADQGDGFALPDVLLRYAHKHAPIVRILAFDHESYAEGYNAGAAAALPPVQFLGPLYWTWSDYHIGATGTPSSATPEPVPVAVPPTAPEYQNHITLAISRLCEFLKSGD